MANPNGFNFPPSSNGSLRRSSPDGWFHEDNCRERRRRRIELRRNAVPGAEAATDQEEARSPPVIAPPAQNVPSPDGLVKREVGSSSSQPHGHLPVQVFNSWWAADGIPIVRISDLHHGSSAVEGVPLPASANARVFAIPVVGAVAVAGRLRDMEDTISIRPNLCSPTINRRRPLHLFAVFDGHGGPHVSLTCRELMHVHLEQELMAVQYPVNEASILFVDESLLHEAWKVIMTRAFRRTEQWALRRCICGSEGYKCHCKHRTMALWSGSTAVVAVVTQEHIVVANCGDSRAVLCRGGRMIPLSFDHKPDRADEKARILALGGRVVDLDTPRVEGILAMSRAIGDRFLKPSVTSEPEVTFTRRHEEDEVLIMASDGMWDVMSSEMSCNVARECLMDPIRSPNVESIEDFTVPNDPVEFPSRSAFAAALLTRLALARGSGDNISVVVVDLKRAVPPLRCMHACLEISG